LGAADASTLRWTSQADILTFDPHAQNEGLNNTANSYIYEPPISYDDKFALEPALAESWNTTVPNPVLLRQLPEFDKLVDAMKSETDRKKRDDLIARALLLHNQQVMHVPLHNQVIPWAMRKNVTVVHRADNRLDARWIRID
jgi:ABC-type transport system substrate-binding protein